MGTHHENLARDWLRNYQLSRQGPRAPLLAGCDVPYGYGGRARVVDCFLVCWERYPRQPPPSPKYRLVVLDFKHSPESPDILAERLQSYHGYFKHSWAFVDRLKMALGPTADRRDVGEVDMWLVVDHRNDRYLQFLDLNRPKLQMLGFPLGVQLYDPESGRGETTIFEYGETGPPLRDLRDRWFGGQTTLGDVLSKRGPPGPPPSGEGGAVKSTTFAPPGER